MRVEGAVVVRLTKQGLYGQQYRANRIKCRPLLFQNIKTDIAVSVNVGVEALGGELNSWGLVWVSWKQNGPLLFRPAYAIKINFMYLLEIRV